MRLPGIPRTCYQDADRREHPRHENLSATNVCDPTKIPNRCPVAAYRFFEARRPVDLCNATDPYYIAPVTNNSSPGIQQKWFLRGPIGHNKLNTILKEMAKKADLPTDKTITNTRKGATETLAIYPLLKIV